MCLGRLPRLGSTPFGRVGYEASDCQWLQSSATVQELGFALGRVQYPGFSCA